jgi:hypothetical protein
MTSTQSNTILSSTGLSQNSDGGAECFKLLHTHIERLFENQATQEGINVHL